MLVTWPPASQGGCGELRIHCPVQRDLLPLGDRKANGLVHNILLLSFDSSGFPGSQSPQLLSGSGWGELCTSCFWESLPALMLTGNSGTLFSLYVPVYVRENTRSQIVQGNCMATEFGTGRTIKSLHLTRPWLPGIQNGNNDDSYLQGCSKT